MRVLVKNGVWTQVSGFSKALGTFIEPNARIAVVGSGGKTSIIMKLAEEQRALGKKVLILTTTHMYKPEKFGVFSELTSDVESALNGNGIAIVGKKTSDGKIAWQGDGFYSKIAPLADVVLIEADGSKRLPVKLPGETEPVIPKDTNLILAVSGLSAIGQNGKDACHRWELARQALNLEDSTILCPEHLLGLMEKGYFNPLRKRFTNVPIVPVFNQADGELAETGKKIIDELNPELGIVSSMKTEALGFILMASGFGKRFGSNKLIYPLNGKPLYSYALSNLIETESNLKKDFAVNIAVVSQYREILDSAERNSLIAVYNPDSDKGITSSLKLGLKNLPPSEHYVCSVADQPYFRVETMADFIRSYIESGKTIGCVTDGTSTGNPVIYNRKYLQELLELEGDKGGKQVVMKHPEEVFYYKVGPYELFDLDRPEDLP